MLSTAAPLTLESLADLSASRTLTLDVVCDDGAVRSRELYAVRLGYIEVVTNDNRLESIDLDAIEAITSAVCSDCGRDSDQPAEADSECEQPYSAHPRPTCTGCGDEITADTDLSRHQRCHLIP